MGRCVCQQQTHFEMERRTVQSIVLTPIGTKSADFYGELCGCCSTALARESCIRGEGFCCASLVHPLVKGLTHTQPPLFGLPGNLRWGIIVVWEIESIAIA